MQINIAIANGLDERKYIGLSINKNVIKINKKIIFIVDNKTLYHQYTTITQHLPRLIKNNQIYVNYDEIILITTFPKISKKNITENNIFNEISKIQKPLQVDNSHDHYETLIEILNEEIYKPQPHTKTFMFSNIKSQLMDESLENVFNQMAEKLSMTYYDFNIMNQQQLIANRLMYVKNINNGQPGNEEFIEYISTYEIERMNETVEVCVENGSIMGSTGYISYIPLNMNILIECYDLKTVKIYINQEEQTLTVTDQNIIKYFPHALSRIKKDIIIHMTEKEVMEPTKIHLENMKSIIKKSYDTSQKNGDIETSRSLVWIMGTLRQMFSDTLINLINIAKTQINDESNSINKLACLSKNTISVKKLNTKLTNKIFDNKQMLTQSEKIYELSDETTKFISENENLIETEHSGSLELFYSSLTLSNWMDELKNGSSMGILIKVNSDNFSKLGLPGSRIKVEEITISCLSTKDYIDSVTYHFNKNLDKYGNLNGEDVIKGNGLGMSNAVMPLYINKYHWEQSKKHMPYILGIIIAHNPLGYDKKHDNFVFYLLMDMTMRTHMKKSNFSIVWSKLYLNLLRTCSEIAFEKGYHTGIKNFVDKYLKDSNKRSEQRPFDTDVFLAQILCCCTKIDDNNLKILMQYIYEETLKRKVLSYYNKKYMHYIVTLNKEDLKSEIKDLIKYIDEKINYCVAILISFYKMFYVLKTIVSEYGGFKYLLNIIDVNHGNVPEDICKKFMTLIEVLPTNLSYTHLYKIIREDDSQNYIVAKVLHIIDSENLDTEVEKNITLENIIDKYRIKYEL